MSYRQEFERCELKYLVGHQVVAELLRRVEPFVRPDPHNGEAGSYPVASLYYDTPRFDAFWEKLDGLPFRRKIRVRLYPEVDGDLAFLEVKERQRNAVKKRRRRAPLGDVLAFLAGNGTAETAELLGPVGEEAAWLLATRRLAPKVMTLYRREAWFGRFDPGLRITVDRDLRYRGSRGEFRYDMRSDPRLFLPSQAVLEVKANDGVPRWLTATLASLDLSVQRLSKFCEAVNARHFHGQML